MPFANTPLPTKRKRLAKMSDVAMSDVAVSDRSDKSSGKTNSWIHLQKAALQEICQENGVEWEKGGKNGKAPTRALLLARLYLAGVGADPNTAMEAEMHVHMMDKNTKKDVLFANLKNIDPNTTLTMASKRHEMALSIARVVVNRQSQPSTDDKGKQPAAGITNQSNLQPSGDLDIGGVQGGESRAFAAAEPSFEHDMGDAHLSTEGLGWTSPSRTHDRPSPSSSTKARMAQVKRHKLDGANISGWRAGSSNQEAAGSFAHATGHAVGSATLQPSTSQASQKGGFFKNLFSSSSKPQEYGTGASFTGSGQGDGQEQAALHIGNTVLELITTHEGIAALISEHFASSIRQDASSKLHSTNEELQREKEKNRVLNDKVQELEEENNNYQGRIEEILDATRQMEDGHRAVLGVVQRVLTDWGEARIKEGTTSFDLLAQVQDRLAQRRVTDEQ